MITNYCPHCGADQRGEPIDDKGCAGCDHEIGQHSLRNGQRTYCCHDDCACDEWQPKYYSHTIGVEVRGVYDGTLFSACPFCYGTWHQWDPVRHGRRYEAAERHRASFTEYLRSRGADFAPPQHHEPLTEPLTEEH